MVFHLNMTSTLPHPFFVIFMWSVCAPSRCVAQFLCQSLSLPLLTRCLLPCHINVLLLFTVSLLPHVTSYPPFFFFILLVVLLCPCLVSSSFSRFLVLLFSLSLMLITELFQRCLEYFWLCDSSGQHYRHPRYWAWGKYQILRRLCTDVCVFTLLYWKVKLETNRCGRYYISVFFS